MLVKVCGMRYANNIREVEEVGIDFMGFIFYDKSKRFVEVVPEYLPKDARRTGVFVNATTDEILEHIKSFHLDAVQLHGKESPEFCKLLRDEINNRIKRNILIIKAISVKGEDDFSICSNYQECVDVFLFDTKCETYGGSGRKFNWELLNLYDGNIPFFVSGGIGPDDASYINKLNHSKLIGIDLNSGFEIRAGLKDVEKLQQFINKLKL